MTNYDEMLTVLDGIIENKYDITTLSNVSSLINMYMDNINWVGFYILRDNELILGPFQGKIACTPIKIGNGVCGTCIKNKETIVVQNVHEFKGHIACDSASLSEICIPLYDKYNNLYGLLDIDSPILNRFNNDDKSNLEKLCNKLKNYIQNNRVE